MNSYQEKLKNLVKNVKDQTLYKSKISGHKGPKNYSSINMNSSNRNS